MLTSSDVDTPDGLTAIPSIGASSDTPPLAESPLQGKNAHKGVSTSNVPTPSRRLIYADDDNGVPHWYALRTTYGRERRAYDYLTMKGVEAFCPIRMVVREVNGRRRPVQESRIPNIFFAYGTEKLLKTFVFDNVHLPFLRFYYRRIHTADSNPESEPLIVPDSQMASLRIICAAEDEDVIIVPSDIRKFNEGQRVRITGGNFKGIEGKVARYHGQQRVAVVINGLLTIATAYIPSAFLERL